MNKPERNGWYWLRYRLEDGEHVSRWLPAMWLFGEWQPQVYGEQVAHDRAVEWRGPLPTPQDVEAMA